MESTSKQSNKKIRDTTKTEETWEKALREATRFTPPTMDRLTTDEYCQKLVNLLKKLQKEKQ